MNTITPLDKFGKFLVENLRDKGIDFAEGLLKSHWKAPSLLYYPRDKILSCEFKKRGAIL